MGLRDADVVAGVLEGLECLLGLGLDRRQRDGVGACDQSEAGLLEADATDHPDIAIPLGETEQLLEAVLGILPTPHDGVRLGERTQHLRSLVMIRRQQVARP